MGMQIICTNSPYIHICARYLLAHSRAHPALTRMSSYDKLHTHFHVTLSPAFTQVSNCVPTLRMGSCVTLLCAYCCGSACVLASFMDRHCSTPYWTRNQRPDPHQRNCYGSRHGTRCLHPTAQSHQSYHSRRHNGPGFGGSLSQCGYHQARQQRNGNIDAPRPIFSAHPRSRNYQSRRHVGRLICAPQYDARTQPSSPSKNATHQADAPASGFVYLNPAPYPEVPEYTDQQDKPQIVFMKAPLTTGDDTYDSDELSNAKIAKRRLRDGEELAGQDLKQKYGKGFAMLQKLGWSENDTVSLGLGKRRNGIVNPVLVCPFAISSGNFLIWNPKP